MADFIKIMPERLKEEASKVRNYQQKHEDIMSRLNNLVMTLTESWEGEAQAAFVSKYQGMKKEFDKFDETLGRYAIDMDDIADKMQRTDQALASRINSLT